MSENLPESDRPWRLYIAVGLFAVLFVSALFFAGRHEPSATTNGPSATAREENLQRRCEEDLAGIMAAVDPRELGLSSNQTDRARDLNLWQADCGALFAGQSIARDEELLRRLLPADVVERTLAAAFTARDVAHLRTTLLMRQTSQHATAGLTDPLAQTVALFDFVQRNVLEVGAVSPTMTPYEVMLIGRGSAEQRAWLLAELLRQIELDAVIIRPAKSAAAASDLWLLGVPLKTADGSGVYLFDLVAGLPIPSAAEATAATVTITRPATLAEVRNDPSLLTQLDLPGQPYRLKSTDLAGVQVGLIGHSSLWANRVATLDFATELRGAIFYDGLGPNRLREPSLYDRVLRAGDGGGWSAQDVSVWPLPESQLQAFGTPTAEGQPLIANYLSMLAGPIVRDITDPMTGLKFKWSHPLIGARHLHITGVYREAIQDYNRIRSGIGVFTIDPLNDLCRESAMYWTAGCQFEQGQFESVLNTALRGGYPPAFTTGAPPIWPDGMAWLASFSLARTERWAEGAAMLRQFRLPVPHGQQYLVRRWERLAKPDADAAPATVEPAPATSPAQPATPAAPDGPPADSSPVESGSSEVNPPSDVPAANPS